jgi:hypothetical protein
MNTSFFVGLVVSVADTQLCRCVKVNTGDAWSKYGWIPVKLYAYVF